MADQGADKQVMEKPVEALMKISVTMADICKAQAATAELLKAIHEEQQQQRDAMVKLAAVIDGRGLVRYYRPN